MGSQHRLCWNSHQSNMLSVFGQLLQSEALVDVTLACDGLSLKAHKVVLSACSPYFQALFQDNPCHHPIVFLKDVLYSDLKALLDFMYKGEVIVSQEQLNAVIETAKSLKVKGLSEMAPKGPCDEPTFHVSKQLANVGRDPMDTQDNDSSESMVASCTAIKRESSASPPVKRWKASCSSVPENVMPSDHENSDARDLSIAPFELLESCLDIHDNTYFSKSIGQFHANGSSSSNDNCNNRGSQQSSIMHEDGQYPFLPDDTECNGGESDAPVSPSRTTPERKATVSQTKLASKMVTEPPASSTKVSIRGVAVTGAPEEIFTRELLKKRDKSQKLMFTKEEYYGLIAKLKAAKMDKRHDQKFYYYLRRYEVLECGNDKRLIKKRNGDDSTVYYIPIEETYNVIKSAHLATHHGGRDRMAQYLRTNYANITREALTLFKDLCVACQAKKRRL